MNKQEKLKTVNANDSFVNDNLTAEVPLGMEQLMPEERILQLEAELTAKSKESTENWDRFIRERADLENYRKRVSREKEELLSYCTKSLIEEILPVVEGIRMTHGMLLAALKKFGVTAVESPGAPFDPAFHQAMAQVPTSDTPPNTVMEEFQKGYMLKERLLRPAMVSVSTGIDKS